MSFLQKSLLILFLLLLNQASSCLASRQAVRPPPGLRLSAAIDVLEGGAGLVGCWQAMLELRSCTNEIVLFFLNGETYLTIPCCQAIRLITSSCWPAMFSALGFTSEEADILRGYCDAESALPPVSGGDLPLASAITPSP